MVSDLTLAGSRRRTSGNPGHHGRLAVGLRALLQSEPFPPFRSRWLACCATACSRAKRSRRKSTGRSRATISQAGQSVTGESHQNPLKALRMSYIAASVAGVTFFILSVSLLGLLPWSTLNDQIVSLAPTASLELTALSTGAGKSMPEKAAPIATRNRSVCRGRHRTLRRSDLAWETAWKLLTCWGHGGLAPICPEPRIPAPISGTWLICSRPEAWYPSQSCSPIPNFSTACPPSPARGFGSGCLSQHLRSKSGIGVAEGEIAMRQSAGDDQWTLMSLDADY